jgi:hypothetical protein
MRRRLVTLMLAVGVVVAVPAVAGADEPLERYLVDGAAAEFAGSGVVMCEWGGGMAAVSYSVVRSGGMTMVEGTGGHVMVSAPMMAVRSDSEWRSLEVDGAASWALSPRYSMGEVQATTRLGRSAHTLSIMEGGLTRARLIIDAETGVALHTEVYDGDGRVFRTASLTEFVPGPIDYPDRPSMVGEQRMIPSIDAVGSLPASAGGYRQVDTYGGPAGSVQGFFTDGLFSFSVFESKRMELPAAFAEASDFVVGGHSYRRIVTASHVWLGWSDADRTYILVGDLPPDHLEAALADMPEPGEPNVLVKMWRRLFG